MNLNTQVRVCLVAAQQGSAQEQPFVWCIMSSHISAATSTAVRAKLHLAKEQNCWLVSRHCLLNLLNGQGSPVTRFQVHHLACSVKGELAPGSKVPSGS